MDQAASANQGVLWDQRQRRQDSDLDRRLGLCAGAIIRKRLGLEMSLYQILQIFSITLLEKMPISCVLEAFDSRSELLDNSNQLILFEF